MKIYYKSKIAKLFTFIDGYKTIMLFGAVFTERDAISLRAEYHEDAHCNQYHTLFDFGMFVSLLTIGLCLAIFIKFNPTPAPSEQHGIIYRFQINNKKYVFMFSNNYDGKSDLIQNADEDVDCMTYAQDTSLYSNDSFFVFV